MLISETGKAGSGYTLLEVLGVICLIGLVLALAQPQIFQVEEKHQVRYAGELLQTDLQRVRAEAKAGNAVKLKINANGYCFPLGDTVITRDYRAHGLVFRVGNNGVGVPATLAPERSQSKDVTGETTATVTGESELSFTPEGSGPLTTISWESKHYQGALKLEADGAVSWRYHVK